MCHYLGGTCIWDALTPRPPTEQSHELNLFPCYEIIIFFPLQSKPEKIALLIIDAQPAREAAAKSGGKCGDLPSKMSLLAAKNHRL